MATGRRRGRAVILLAFILILLVVLFLVFYRFNPMAQAPGQPATNNNASAEPTATLSPVEKVVVVAQRVNRGQEFREDYLAVGEIARESYNPSLYYRDIKEVKGSKARFDMEAGTLLTKNMVVRPGDPGVIPSFEIPQGKVAISVPISKLSSLAYGLQKGDHVNVIASLLMVDMDTNFQSKLPNRSGIVIAPGPIDENQTYVTALLQSPPDYEVSAPSAASYLGRIEIDPTMNNPVFIIPSEEQRPRLVSQTLIQDVVVLQMGTFGSEGQPAAVAGAGTEDSTIAQDPDAQATPTRTPRAQQGQAEETSVELPDVITLIVSPQDAVSLNYLMLSGANLNLVLRSAGDTELRDTEAVTLQFILDQYRIPNPAKLPYGQNQRVDEFPSTINPFPEPAVRPTEEVQE